MHPASSTAEPECLLLQPANNGDPGQGHLATPDFRFKARPHWTTSPAVIALASMENQSLACPRQPRVENQRRDARWNVRAEKTKEDNVTPGRASQPNDTSSSPSLCLGPNPTPKSSFGYACAELRQLVPAVRRRRPHALPTCLMRMLRPLIGGKCHTTQRMS